MSERRFMSLTREQRDAVQAALESAAMPMGDAIEKCIEDLLAAWDAAADTEQKLLAARMRAEKVYNGTDPYPMRGDGYIAMTLIDAVLKETA